MTRDVQKTLTFVVIAMLLTGAAILKVPDRSAKTEDFNDQGMKFFPEFVDPFACTDLEVVEYDNSIASARQFKVLFKNNRWVIPSHHNYPADAKDRLAKTAAGVMDLTKDTIRSDRAEDHEALGVIDPLDLKASLKGRGKRVTLRDSSEKVLADFIIGNEVRERSGQRYVRDPKSKRTYGVNVKADLSTRFSDWIETNLLKLDSARIRSVKFDNHKVDPEQRRIIPGDVFTIERKESSSPWTLVGGLPSGTEVHADKTSGLSTALADLKIVGVRPKPEGLSRDLKLSSSNEIKPNTTAELQSLISKGFYPTREGIFSNQGDVIVSTDEGAVYTLRFGEVVFSSGEQLEAGGKDEGKKTSSKAEGTTESRYLMVTVAFDPKLIPQPEKPSEALSIPDDPFQKGKDDPKRIADEKQAKEKADREKADRDRKVSEGEKKVKALSDRFADWYYVTPGDSFRAIALDRATLIGPKQEKPMKDAGGPLDGLPSGFDGLPPGHPRP
ncbi:MAG: hypothetical protein NVSMB9_14450 [Isosphaeraceae bacterium]